jgi:hypothetical protein
MILHKVKYEDDKYLQEFRDPRFEISNTQYKMEDFEKPCQI